MLALALNPRGLVHPRDVGAFPFKGPMSASAAASVTWSAAYSHADYSFDASALVATKGSGGSGLVSVKASANRTEAYYEAVITTVPSGFVIVGLDKDNVVLNDWPGDTSGIGYINDGRVTMNGGTTQFTGSTFAQGDIIGICLKAGKAYFSKNGVWQNSADPSAGTGGVDVSAMFTSGYPTASLQVAGAVITGRFLASSFSYTIPTGVSAWDAAAAGTTYNDTLSESLTAAYALSGTVTFTSTIAEALTSADSLSGSAIFAASLNEAVASSDSLSATATFRPTISESVTGSDSLSAAATFNGSLTEGLTASDSLTGGLLLTGTLSETIAASYSLSGLVTFAGPLTETLSASDGLTATATYIASLLETAAVADDYLATTTEATAPYVPSTIHHGFHKLSLTRITWGPDSAGGAAWKPNDETQNSWSSGSGQSGANWKKS